MVLVPQATNNKFFIELSSKYSEKGTCPKIKVGAVLTINNRIIAAGYNGAPSKMDHCEEVSPICYEKNNHCINALHAEQSILLFCSKNGIKTNNSILYITHYPCSKCTQYLIQAGIIKVYYKEDYKNKENIFCNFLQIIKI
tara:strand:- start:120 stop:542 length:423 start_codon:yes stop_codon:yes gene_type:complete